MEGGRAVGGERDPAGLAQGGHAEEVGDARAARGVRLQDVHRARVEHALEVGQVVAVLAGRDLHARGRAVAQEPQPFEVVRGDRLLEPRHAVGGEALGQPQRFLARVGAVGVDEQLDLATHGLARRPHARGIGRGLASHLHLHHAHPLAPPAAELRAQLVDGVGGEAAAAVDGHARAHRPEQGDEGDPEQARLEVPEGDVHGGHGRGDDAGPPQVADGVAHGRPRGRHRHGVAADHDGGQDVADEGGRGGRRVRVAEALLAPGGGFRHHQDGRRPLEGPVGLRGAGRDPKGRDVEPFDRYGPRSHGLRSFP